ncbi:MAG: peptidylprolyl isomerase [candidate division WOR-3 bacterium]|nr:MAG: peptidylprolyl isomerase [candidate division WOR-3 bacterium]
MSRRRNAWSLGRRAAWLLILLVASALAGSADSIIVVVGETVVLESELSQAVDFLRLASADTMMSDSALRATVLEQIIQSHVLQERARDDTITVTRDEIAAEVENSIAQLKARFEDEEQFRTALASEGMTERSLRQRYEDEVRRRLLSQKLMQKEGLTQVYISPAEAERFYDQNQDSIAWVPGRVTLAHILIGVVPSQEVEEEKQRKAAEVLDILARGGDFGVVAGSFSEDWATRNEGGDMGWHDLADLPLDQAMVLDQLQPGQISPYYRSLEGYVILKLDEKSGQRVKFRNILVRVPLTRADTTRARAKAVSVRKKALEGASFGTLARENSMDPATADSGGFLGEFAVKGLTPPFDSVVMLLDSGEISEPVQSEHGFHLIQVIDKQPERLMTYLEMQDMIRNYLFQQKQAERVQKYIERISEDVYIKRYY